MKRTIVRKSLRQTVTENQAALDFMSKLAGCTGHENKVVFEPARARAPRDPTVLTEAQIQKTILQYLKAHPKVAFAIRVNSGAFIESYGGHERYIQANSMKGCSDILLMLKGGRFGAIEVKSLKGRVTPDQDNFILSVLEGGGYAGVARAIEDVNKILHLE